MNSSIHIYINEIFFMQQSPSISIEQESLSTTISYNSSEQSLNKTNKLIKWYRIIKRIVQFFRFIKIPILRSRFIDMINYMSIDNFEFEGLNGYKINKIQEDLLFLDDIKRYQEVFNTFLSFGFVWEDKEFQMAKLKANYIYDHYMSTSEAIAKTNIPTDTIPSIYNRIASPKIFSSLTYLNLFNDAEKFLTEKILMIYMCEGLNCFSISPQKQFIAIMNRFKGNQITNGSISSFEHLKEINKIEKPLFDHSNIKLKDKFDIESSYDELIIPNWTYSTDLGFVYNPIREKRMKVLKTNIRKKTKDFDSNDDSIIKFSHNIPNELKLLNSTLSKSTIPISSKNIQHSSKILSHTHRQHINNTSIHLISKDKSLLQHKKHDILSDYYRCNSMFNKNIIDKRQFSKKIFICKVHSSSWPESYQFKMNNEIPYRMIQKHQAKHSFNRIQQSQRLCH
ncbi:unnamed protein product [Rotaria sordida]|uniref:RGS domain-containing protein n=1 Tax=Rotaria sordida TaxID=392033 RepID=A0A813ZXP8_9BILA|nr:unnamed protein product [Rotaria sordida]